MPNHVINVLKFKKLKQDEVVNILNSITIPLETPLEDDVNIWPLNCCMDFNKIIPEPCAKEECPEDCLVNKDSHIMEYEDRPWFDWYTWHLKYWGTKWNAYNCYVKIGKSYLTIVFQTAWSMPRPIYEQLTKLGHDFEAQYADEDYGHNCGKLIYNPAKTGFEDIVHIREDDLTNPRKYSQYLWNKYE